ncbi:MAG: hypothetical protein BEN18_01255 [Epulopiscium sp. Nuni2H_MBin001]|nr:MAG: hypothetical protein BEN18_01255 [Epulopiscium sp. Nuni2H_MBin001]
MKSGKIMGVVALFIIAYIAYTAITYQSKDISQLKVSNTILEFDPLKMEYVGVNEGQVIYISGDGIKALNKKGEEVWADTFSLKDIIVSQKEPYLAVSNLRNKQIYLFNDKGKQAEISLQNPVVGFCVNPSGYVAVIEEIDGGHIISAYDNTGRFLEVNSGSFTSNGDYPIAVEISPNNELIMVSYLYLGDTQLASTVGAIAVAQPLVAVGEPMLFGNMESDNLVYEIEFISNNVWASIGDKFITFYSINGEILRSVDVSGVLYSPVLTSMPKIGGFIPIVKGVSHIGSTVHAVSELTLLNSEDSRSVEMSFESPISYVHANNQGVVVGDGRVFKAYNKIGIQYLEYHARQDVNQLIATDDIIIAVTKDSVVRLEKNSI